LTRTRPQSTKAAVLRTILLNLALVHIHTYIYIRALETEVSSKFHSAAHRDISSQIARSPKCQLGTLVVTLIPVLDLSRLNILEVELVVAHSRGNAAAHGGDDVDEDVVELPEGEGSADGASRVHRAAREGALGEHTRDNRQTDGQRSGVLYQRKCQ
jgi:hypothetical protein